MHDPRQVRNYQRVTKAKEEADVPHEHMGDARFCDVAMFDIIDCANCCAVIVEHQLRTEDAPENLLSTYDLRPLLQHALLNNA